MIQAKHFISGIFFLMCANLAGSVYASSEPSPQTAQEISHLLDYLQHSGCEFNRNGSWYKAPDAVKHLNKKYEYLLKKGWVSSAEVFIERAATESSMSGKPYLVKCGASEALESKLWFSKELSAFRQSHKHK